MEERLHALETGLLPAEYHAAQRLVTEAERLIAAPPTFPTAADDLDPFALGEIREEWVLALIDRKDNEQRLQRRRAILTEFRSVAQSRANTAASSIADEVLVGCHHELVKLLDEAADLAEELDGVDSAEKAIAADLGQAWKRLRELADDYSTLRRFQISHVNSEMVSRSRPSAGGEEHASDLYIRNLDDLWPEWRTGGAANGLTFNHVGSAVHRYEPWPTEPVQLLLWLATSRVEPWVPTSAQLQRHWVDRRKRANPGQMPEPITVGGRRKQSPPQYGREIRQIKSPVIQTGGIR